MFPSSPWRAAGQEESFASNPHLHFSEKETETGLGAQWGQSGARGLHVWAPGGCTHSSCTANQEGPSDHSPLPLDEGLLEGRSTQYLRRDRLAGTEGLYEA